MIGNVKKGMKNDSVEYEKTRETLPQGERGDNF